MVDKLLNDASYRSYWRGYEYFKEGRVKNMSILDFGWDFTNLWIPLFFVFKILGGFI